MQIFPSGHATHPQWRMAAALVLAQLRAQMALPSYAANPALGLLYITDHYAGDAAAILDHLQAELPGVPDWAGTVGVGIAANNAEYIDEPALAVMLCALPSDQYRVFSGVAPLAHDMGLPGAGAFVPHSALLHADGAMPDLAGLLAELAQRTTGGYLFGGLASGSGARPQFAVSGNGNVPGQGAASGVFEGGLSGVAFAAGVPMVSRVTQGCQPVGPVRTITACDEQVVLELDGEPALDVLLATLEVSLDDPQPALQRVRATLVGLLGADGGAAQGGCPRGTGSFGARHFGADVRVRHIVGLDPARHGIAVADAVEPGMRMAFCRRNAAAARVDLVRICSEIREELEPEEVTAEVAVALAPAPEAQAPHPARRIAGAVYVSCAGRGGPHFGGPSAEMQIVRHALGDVPLVGFFAGGEIAHQHLYGYTGVLTVFVAGGDSSDAR
ncbi:FIST C-terminal domain-containing protein [Ramlibacter sp. H39-3-26]|uniref:FIST signal transduction protein n=1 Tax=Curvibacter soli TaxID=3031331 RepID=UPI0023DB81A0|nr:FIST N-terminal domain-containing protein [Ramlibacter sp. H39-3-26]MDF1486256.1 FIST C-terminal domain-containing protein [Ramlibacter sp. H39-3-26]